VSDIRTRIAAFAVILGLGGLGGYAVSHNQAATQADKRALTPTTQVIRRTVHAKNKMPPAGAPPVAGTPQSTLVASAPVSSGSSGSSSSSAPSTSPAPVKTHSSGSGSSKGSSGGSHRAPVKTHSSGGGGGGHEHEGGKDD
jgi:hypothetical protein